MCRDARLPGVDHYGCQTLQQCRGRWVAQCTAEEMSRNNLADHFAYEKRSPLSNQNTPLVSPGKQWASLSAIFHALTTHPQKNELFSEYLLACCFLIEGCAVPGSQVKGESQRPIAFHVK